MINPMQTPGLSHIFSFLWKMYGRLNHLEKVLAPSLAAGYKPLFTGQSADHPDLKIAVLVLIVLALGYNTFEAKQKFGQPSHNPLLIFEPVLKASAWGYAFVEIWQHLSILAGAIN